jgi:hypothetical protein
MENRTQYGFCLLIMNPQYGLHLSKPNGSCRGEFCKGLRALLEFYGTLGGDPWDSNLRDIKTCQEEYQEMILI